MNKKWSWILLASTLIIVIAGAGVLYNKFSKEVENDRLMVEDATQAGIEDASSTNEAEEEAAQEHEETEELTKSPDFTVYDLEGNAVKLSDFIGKPVVLNFWASWCGPCKSEMPEFEQKYRELGSEVQFLMVNMTDGGQETVEKASGFIEQAGYTFPVYYDTDMDAAMTYGVTSIPTTYFIDAEGNGIAWAQGMIDAETLQTGIDMIAK